LKRIDAGPRFVETWPVYRHLAGYRVFRVLLSQWIDKSCLAIVPLSRRLHQTLSCHKSMKAGK